MKYDNVNRYKYIQNLQQNYDKEISYFDDTSCNYNKSYNRNKTEKKRKKYLKILVFLLIFVIFCLIFIYFYVNPQIINGHKAHIKNYGVNLINNAISSTIANNEYDDLITITKNSDGNISLLSVNSKNVNLLTNNIMTLVQNKLNQQNALDYKLPLGTFTGLPFLSGVGPDVSLKIIPVGNVSTKYRSQISSLSINQSYHKIYLTITVSVCVFLPLYTQDIDISSQVLIAESLIVGQIPSTYLNTDNLTNALNLIPQ